MTRFSHIFFIALVALYPVTGENQAKEPKYVIKNNKKLRDTFNKLIYAVTSVNQERVQALKKFYELQNYLPKVSRSEEEESVVVVIPNHKNVGFQRDATLKDLYNNGPNTEPEGTHEILKKTFFRNGDHNENFMKIDSEETLQIDEKYFTNEGSSGLGNKGTHKILKDLKETYLTKNMDGNMMKIGSEGLDIDKALRKWKGCNKSAAKACKKACNNAFKSVCADYKCSKSMKKTAKRSCKSKCNAEFSDGD